MSNTTNKFTRDSDGTLSSFAWPGGYPIVYTLADSGCICPDCANGKNGSEASIEEDTPDDWHIVSQDIYWEGCTLHCDNCDRDMDSAYGNPEPNQS